MKRMLSELNAFLKGPCRKSRQQANTSKNAHTHTHTRAHAYLHGRSEGALLQWTCTAKAMQEFPLALLVFI